MHQLSIFDENGDVIKAQSEPAFVVDIDGFEGPLDLLLDLARRQKVDLARISISALAEQYLLFVAEARRRRLELAADYLVMAAWLAYLKSRLLLPDVAQEDDGPSAEILAEQLARRLVHLEAIRKVAARLMVRPQLGYDMFARGAPEGVTVQRQNTWEASLYDLLASYARQRQQSVLSHVTIRRRPAWPLADARAVLERLLGRAVDWISLDMLFQGYVPLDMGRRSVLASAFSASLELVREGELSLKQEHPFGPLWLKSAQHSALRAVG
jgi:segregation and condensation protein A